MYNCAPAQLNKVKIQNKINVQNNSDVFTASPVSQPNMDTVSFRGQKEVYLDKLNQLFPGGGIERVYESINKDFGIDKPAELKFYGDNDGVQAGGFTFSKNEISLSLSDLLDSNTKVVGVKDGKRTILVSPSVKLPLFIDEEGAQNFVKLHSQKGNLGYDELLVEPLTDDEKRKFIIQKIAHEVIHAQQHMIMRQTEGIGEKEIIKAWTHAKPKNLIENAILNYKVMDMYNNSYWASQKETPKTISKDSAKGKFAKVWLEAVRNYPPVNSPEYTKNPIELDAYMRSYEYLKSRYGDWN